MVNYIFARHGWPMIVVRARDKYDYLEALHQTDMAVGDTPSEGANATLNHIKPFLNCFSKIVEAEMQYNIDFLSDSSEDSWWYDGNKIKFRSKNSSAILTLLKNEPVITIDTIAKSLGIVPLAVKKQLRQMVIKGYIQRREKDGSWHVFASQSI